MSLVTEVKAEVKYILGLDGVQRVFHTFWQAAGGVLFAHLITAKSSADVKGAIVVAVAAGLAAAKGLYVSTKG